MMNFASNEEQQSPGGGSGTVIEGFEGAIVTGAGTTQNIAGGLTWQGGAVGDFSGTNTPISIVQVDATEGSDALQMDAPQEQFAAFIQEPAANVSDYSAYDTIEMDITIETMGYSAGHVLFGIQDAGATNTASDQTPNGQTGSFTLTLDISGIDRSALFMSVTTTIESGVAHDYKWRIDNIRAS